MTRTTYRLPAAIVTLIQNDQLTMDCIREIARVIAADLTDPRTAAYLQDAIDAPWLPPSKPSHGTDKVQEDERSGGQGSA